MVGTSNKSVPVAWPLIYGISGYPNVFWDMYNIIITVCTWWRTTHESQVGHIPATNGLSRGNVHL